MRTSITAAALALIAIPAVASAGGPAPFSGRDDPMSGQGQSHERRGGPMRMDPSRMFDMIDADRNGSITRSEFMAAHHRLMQRKGSPFGR